MLADIVKVFTNNGNLTIRLPDSIVNDSQHARKGLKEGDYAKIVFNPETGEYLISVTRKDE
jgi:hypothetical protein